MPHPVCWKFTARRFRDDVVFTTPLNPRYKGLACRCLQREQKGPVDVMDELSGAPPVMAAEATEQ